MSPRRLVNDSLRRITHDPARVPLPLVEEFVKLAERRKRLPWVADAVPMTGRSIRRAFQRYSQFVAMIRDITAPTLVVQGIADQIVSPTSVEWLCSLRPDWTLIQMEDTGHTPQIDAPVRFMGVLTPWLESLSKREKTA
jgi:pimeloyl-ACP methyl ester carboxylesterase